jgi:hypothetical protein
LKLHEDWNKLLKESPEFRVRMREVLPQLFMGFSPGENPEDAKELRFLVDRQRMLSSYGRMLVGTLSEEKLKSLFEKVRQQLRAVNTQKYDKDYAEVDDYQLIKQFDKIDQELKGSIGAAV